MNAIIDYYNRYDEDSRLDRDNYHRTEFLVTLKLLEPYLEPGGSILDIGAGTGRYSCYYAGLGHSVTALDLTPRHVEAIRDKAARLKLEDRLSAVEGDALDLGRFADASFDAVLCMGPLYHLADHGSRNTCIKECLRVLKPGGLLAAAYVNRTGEYLYRVMCNPQVLLEEPPALSFAAGGGISGGCFVSLSPVEVEELIHSFPVVKKEHAATDGISAIMLDTVNNMNPVLYEQWLQLMLLTNRSCDSLGSSLHNLYIACKK
ncbi:MAG: methyltransferase type 11 [Paenibacillaceae bacterium]|nr:methyltransferase type 11 [Paenibacillaceae bacterium]